MRKPEIIAIVKAAARRLGGNDGSAQFVFNVLAALERDRPEVLRHITSHYPEGPYRAVKLWIRGGRS